MRSDIATIIAFGLGVCSMANAAAPTYSCFDPPDEGQTNPLGEGMEDVVESECCEALIDESDIEVDRKVIWDPVNCNHGPGESAITEEPLCRAHDTDGCRFCHESCNGLEGLCITCDEMYLSMSDSPTPSPSDGFEGSMFPVETPAPSMVIPAPTGAPFDMFPATPVPAAATPAATEAPATAEVSDCECVNSLSEEEMAVLARRSKNMVCDPTCSDGTDLIWDVLNCDYFALGQNCRACSNMCTDQGDGNWLDQDDFPCKPCSAI
ncbi:unnamed protein product [Scytosiphon promiscuus]